jgi:magnesium-transporting ATPase (P-type)
LENILKFVDESSREGLRTLLVAYKIISEKELQIFLE